MGLVPLFLFGIHLLLAYRRRELSTLSVSNSEIIGSYTAFIPVSKITLKMPIEKIDNIAAVNSVFFIYTGKALRISSTSGSFKIPYVLNADEVVSYISNAIEKAKSERGSTAVASPSRNVQEKPADSLKKIAELRDMGVITEEEFEEKKKEILGKM